MRILFAGSPEIAVPSLERTAGEHTVVGVLTNPDSTRGRGREACVTSVKSTARDLGLTILQPEKLDGAFREQVRALAPDLLVAVAYGRIFGPRFLELFPRGGVNVHPSLLPRYRGSSPINAAILNGDSLTGLTIQRLALEMDSGDILMQQELPLDGTETAESLTAVFAGIGAELLSRTLRGLEAGTLTGIPQDHSLATYCGYIRKDDGKIDWSLSAREIHRRFRGYYPWPGIFTFHKGLKLNILKANVYTGTRTAGEAAPGTVLGMDNQEGFLIQTGNGILAVTELQLQAKKPLGFRDFGNGNRDFSGSHLGGE